MDSTKDPKGILEEIEPESVDVSSFEVQDILHPEFWDEAGNLNEEIANKLYEIAKEFFQGLELDWVEIVDVTMTGSLANFNWSEYSDIDLHVIVDYTQVDDKQDLVQDFFRTASSLWNRNHKILIKGFEVEVYVQDSNEPHYSTGVFSIRNNKWNTEPSREENIIDEKNIKKKAAAFMNDIDAVYELFEEGHYEETVEQAEKLKERIRKLRQSGLEDKGAFSVENLAFKILRRTDYLRRLSSVKTMAYDKSMSINEE